MRVLLINTVCGIGSTGRICADIADKLSKEGHEVKIAYGRGEVPEKCQKYAVKIGSDMEQKCHGIRTRLLDEHGFGSKKATEKFLIWAEEYHPDMVWLHNLHGYYINIELLFEWLKKRSRMEVKWTLHDCWAFTGHCVHFSMANCEQWKTHCMDCPQKGRYPSSLLKDNCKQNFDRKKAAFTGVKQMTLITPSNWLADLVRQSFLGEYPVEIHHNTIDTEIFKPTPGNFRERFGLQSKKIILGVASVWDERKGLRDFIQLAAMLDEQYVIVLVGLSEKQSKALPKGIISVGKTNSTKELAEIYSAADLFVNPSKEETFGMTTIEAQACGTKAIVYKGTACEEIVGQYGGIAVEQSVESLKSAIETALCGDKSAEQ